EKLLGKGKDKDDDWTWYYYKDSSIKISYSDGDCTEGFLAPKDTVVKVYIDFKEERELSELRKKVNLKMLRAVRAYDTNAKEYYDDERGISYYADLSQKLWHSITFYPSAEYSQFRCED
ncbi:MAG TPA: hypothetical protein VER14_00945, partial [Phototrophicaceae bacterium]|nr:hypothetical protein [Phototrophicaceae bacterium]